MEIKELLYTLSELDSIGSITEASDKAYEILSKYADTKKYDTLNVIGKIKGKTDYTIMLDAHIDQIGFVVTDVDENGFLSVATVGGVDLRALPSKAVTVHGKEKITAVFCSTPPHLAKGDIEYDDITKIKLDTALGEKAKDIVSVGDYVTFSDKCFDLQGHKVCGRSFDDRAGVVCLLEVARRLSGKELPVNVVFALSSGEEVGLRGTTTAAFTINPQEAIAVDVDFGDSPDVSTNDSSPLGNGGIIGISPVLDKNLSQKLIDTAKENNIPYSVAVLGGRTSTDADMISISRDGVKTSTLSIPLRNMHSSVEILDLSDIYAVCDLLEKYILKGGVLGA
ncbi:MAG: M20/M25/M40 family metallo-hydrolase [Clostridia bacterium]|nr:M20/M25/M40 family metallo-hydrolase [Clostridia bacterium]